ncbi:MAG: hypothetical protein NC936_00300 [Candidatus Omnitrophica bacterium]|nr:hypothetical protein [Candidatus Omnitrophota bacterium]MCM8770297.1 hypothetical protein [Candidatus Omnitrophota bacterium]
MTSVCFCGIDGSGKSLQANILNTFLNKMGKNTTLVHLFSEKSTVISKSHDKFIVKKFIGFIRRIPNSFLISPIKIFLRTTNAIIDSWVTYFSNLKKYKDRVIIYDRYFYDILVILASEYPRFANVIISFCRFVPRPNRVIILDIMPEKALSRKEGHTLERARLLCKLYYLLSRKIDSYIIDGNQSKEYVAERIQDSLGRLFYDAKPAY